MRCRKPQLARRPCQLWWQRLAFRSTPPSSLLRLQRLSFLGCLLHTSCEAPPSPWSQSCQPLPNDALLPPTQSNLLSFASESATNERLTGQRTILGNHAPHIGSDCQWLPHLLSAASLTMLLIMLCSSETGRKKGLAAVEGIGTIGFLE